MQVRSNFYLKWLERVGVTRVGSLLGERKILREITSHFILPPLKNGASGNQDFWGFLSGAHSLGTSAFPTFGKVFGRGFPRKIIPSGCNFGGLGGPRGYWETGGEPCGFCRFKGFSLGEKVF